MIESKIYYKGINYKQIYFSKNCNEINRVVIKKDFDIIRVYQSSKRCNKYLGEFHTLITDLTEDISEIRKKFTKSIKSEINKNIKQDEVEIKIVINPSKKDIYNFIKNYKEFIEFKSLNIDVEYTLKSFLEIRANIVFFQAIYKNEIIITHSYIVDDEFVKLKTSASLRSDLNKEMTHLISRTNKRMHFEAIKYFKGSNYLLYDWGGVDKDMLSSVSKFKKYFGGNLTTYYEGIIFKNKFIKLKYLILDIGIIGIIKKILFKLRVLKNV